MPGMAGPSRAMYKPLEYSYGVSIFVNKLSVGILLVTLCFQSVAGQGWKPVLVEQPDAKKLTNLYEQNMVILFCSFNASPPATVSWNKNGAVLQLDGRFADETIYQRNKTIVVSKITISSLKASDASTYECVARNSFGTAEGFLTLSLRTAYAPVFKRNFSKVILHSGEHYQQLCIADAYPSASYTWGKVGGFINGQTTKSHPDGRLEFTSADPLKDSGIYQCSAQNNLGLVQSDLEVSVLQDPSWLSPYPPSFISVKSGDQVWINVTATSSRDGTRILWYKENGDKLESIDNPPSELELDQFSSSFGISSVTSKDSGNYTVELQNNKATIKRTISIHVTGPPVVLVTSPLVLNVDISHGSVLDCIAWGYPLPNISWHHNNKTVASYNPLKHRDFSMTDYGDNSVSLSYNAFEAGEFYCIADNVLGTHYAVVNLNARQVVPLAKSKSSTGQYYVFIILVACIVVVGVLCVVLLLVCLKKRKQHMSSRYRQTDNGFSDMTGSDEENEEEDEPSDYLVPLFTFSGGYQSSSAVSPTESNRSSRRMSVDHKVSSLPKHVHIDSLYGPLNAEATSVSFANITIGELVGEGKYANISLGYFVKEKDKEEKEVAIKWLKEGSTPDEQDRMLRELSIMQSVSHHPNIINLLGWCLTDDNVYILEDYAPNGNLLHLLRSYRGLLKLGSSDLNNEYGSLEQSDLLSFAWQIANGMKHLAAMKIVHRNLTARKIIIGHERVCKISGIDQAFSSDKHSNHQKAPAVQLPLRWMSYESLFQGKYSHEADVWSFGVVMWEIVTLGEYPYPGIPDNDLLLKRLQTCFRMMQPQHCSEQLFGLMSSCWAQEPSHRVTFKELCSTIGNLMYDQSEIHIDLQSLAQSFKQDIGYVSQEDLVSFNSPPPNQENHSEQ